MSIQAEIRIPSFSLEGADSNGQWPRIHFIAPFVSSTDAADKVFKNTLRKMINSYIGEPSTKGTLARLRTELNSELQSMVLSGMLAHDGNSWRIEDGHASAYVANVSWTFIDGADYDLPESADFIFDGEI